MVLRKVKNSACMGRSAAKFEIEKVQRLDGCGLLGNGLRYSPIQRETDWRHECNEWLNHVQARQSTDIPDEIYDKILLEIKKQRIVNMAYLTYTKVRDILKKLNGDARKYYEHIPFIIHRLNGMNMPHFSPELEEKLRNLFKEIQVPFSKAIMIVDPERKNFLSYSFVLHKLMQLLGYDEYTHIFSLLRSREKLHKQDQIWRIICDELNWQYIPSM